MGRAGHSVLHPQRHVVVLVAVGVGAAVVEAGHHHLPRDLITRSLIETYKANIVRAEREAIDALQRGLLAPGAKGGVGHLAGV